MGMYLGEHRVCRDFEALRDGVRIILFPLPGTHSTYLDNRRHKRRYSIKGGIDTKLVHGA